jgi:hypothetical protein
MAKFKVGLVIKNPNEPDSCGRLILRIENGRYYVQYEGGGKSYISSGWVDVVMITTELSSVSSILSKYDNASGSSDQEVS